MSEELKKALDRIAGWDAPQTSAELRDDMRSELSRLRKENEELLEALTIVFNAMDDAC